MYKFWYYSVKLILAKEHYTTRGGVEGAFFHAQTCEYGIKVPSMTGPRGV